MSFCSDPLFDSALTTDPDRPDLTQCFNLTLPLYLPCLFLWAFFPYYRGLATELKKGWEDTKPTTQKKPELKLFTPLFLIKVALVLIAALTQIVVLVTSGSKDDWQPLVVYVTPILVLVTLAYELLCLYLHQRMSHYSSPLQFYFWVFLVLLQIPTVALSIRSCAEKDEGFGDAVIQLVFWSSCVLSFVAQCFADVPKGKNVKVKRFHEINIFF